MHACRHVLQAHPVVPCQQAHTFTMRDSVDDVYVFNFEANTVTVGNEPPAPLERIAPDAK